MPSTSSKPTVRRFTDYLTEAARRQQRKDRDRHRSLFGRIADTLTTKPGRPA